MGGSQHLDEMEVDRGGGLRPWRRQVNLEKLGSNKELGFSILVLGVLCLNAFCGQTVITRKKQIIDARTVFSPLQVCFYVLF